MLNLLAIVFVIVMITGITLLIINRSNKGMMVVIILSIFAVNLPIFLLLDHGVYKLHKTEINRVIESRGGIVQTIQKAGFNETPFNSEIGSTNRVYKIRYRQNSQTLIAWYRGTNSIDNVHAKPSKGYEERWIFDDPATPN